MCFLGRRLKSIIALAALIPAFASLGCANPLLLRNSFGPNGCNACTTQYMDGQPVMYGMQPGSSPSALHQVQYQRQVLPPASSQGAQVEVLPPAPGCPDGRCGVVGAASGPGPLPTELTPVSHPPYTVAPPDILFIEAENLIPRPPYRIQALDVLEIVVPEGVTFKNQPIAGKYTVSPDGTVNLGFSYGAVQVAGKTTREAEEAIRQHLSRILRDPQVVVGLASFRGIQQVRGEHLVRPDGTISLGTYGYVYVAGMTLGQIKCVIEKHLSKWVLNPKVSVDVFAYNSKKYYVIYDGGGFGQFVLSFPYTGYETVLDAVAKTNGLPAVSSKRKIWVARPAPDCLGRSQILPVDWRAITEGGVTRTNYQLMPGDRVYVHADALIRADNWLAKIISPIERVLGVTLLGSTTVNSIRSGGFNNAGGLIVAP